MAGLDNKDKKEKEETGVPAENSADNAPDAVAGSADTTGDATSIDPVTARLQELGIEADVIGKIKAELGAETVEDLTNLTEGDLTGLGMKAIPARKLVAACATNGISTGSSDPNAELGDGETPSSDQISGFANMLGGDSMGLMLLMSGQGGDMDLSAMMPINALVAGYNPKRRDLYLMVMGQVERRIGVPIVVINGDGAVNRDLTTEYIDGLEEGREAAENNIYFDSEGTPHEVIRVGVDAQSIYDADPLEPTKALQKSGMGVGRVKWNNVPLEARQVAYYAVIKTGEIDPKNDAHQSWLRDHMKQGVNRLVFHGQAPRAIAEYNEAARTGSLPTLRVMLARSARRPEFMPRRSRRSAKDLSGIGSNLDEI